ncbi:MauE/DoxX family redox-associated membrane protein [Sediminibacterium sp.]|uniref:MauE/DoxX family redox-associated membrane protein n=1 Tax=Sediminibacterium sp. TaxID=1917865 RepID=UPI003522A079
MRPSKAILVSCLILVFILAYTTASKLLNWPHYTRAMLAQPFTDWFNQILIYAIPTLETSAILLLLINKTRKAGLRLTTVILFLFTAYTAWIFASGKDRSTCPCGGLFSQLSWTNHLIVNTSITLLALLTTIFYNSSLNIFHGHEKRRNADASD